MANGDSERERQSNETHIFIRSKGINYVSSDLIQNTPIYSLRNCHLLGRLLNLFLVKTHDCAAIMWFEHMSPANPR